jgi:hypothetical protein
MIWQLTYDIMISTIESIANNGRDKDDNISWCSTCYDKPADIFQAEGNYCLDCWQNQTYPNL